MHKAYHRVKNKILYKFLCLKSRNFRSNTKLKLKECNINITNCLISVKPNRWGRDIEQANDQLSYGHGYDHNFVLDKERAGLEKIATAYSTKSGIKMDVITDCIGMQLYTANFIQGQKVQGGAVCKDRDAFCLETHTGAPSIKISPVSCRYTPVR